MSPTDPPERPTVWDAFQPAAEDASPAAPGDDAFRRPASQDARPPFDQGGGYGGAGPYGPPPGNPYGAPPYGQPPQGPYGQPPYGQPPYGQPPYGQPPYGANPYGANPYGPMPYGYGYAPQAEKGATTSLVLGIVGFFICGILLGPAAIIEGVKARKRIRESNGMLTGDGMALAGIILGGIVSALYVGFIILIIIASMTPTSRVR